jgi:hypothetical protein
MTLALATYVRQHENQQGGLSWGQLLDWYLTTQQPAPTEGEQQQQQQEEEEEAAAEARARAREKAMMVIARMLDVDSTLVPAGER